MSNIIVYGRGKTGQSLYKMSQKLGYSASFYDDNDENFQNVSFAKDGVVVLSPGVKPTAQGILRAKKAQAKLVGELDFCFPHCKGKCVSVTGTNGKTTTCQLIYHVLQYAKRPCRLLGNGGVPFSQEVLEVQQDEIVVLESSSFQLDLSEKFSPYISVVTNVAPDHLDYHGDLSSYVKAKCNNFCHQSRDGFAVFNADDDCALELSLQSSAYTLYYSTCNENANCYFKNGEVHLNACGQHVICPCKHLETLAKHNVSNALCAILVGFLLGVDVCNACDSLQYYKFLPHRLQTVTRFNGVTFVDDSKATNVHATVSALDCFTNVPLALILGGSDKGCSFDDIFKNVKSNVKIVCAVGETAQKIALSAKKYFVDVKICCDYKQATETCYRKLKNIGGVVLMSNACASFDMFDGYEKRGEHFASIVWELCRDEKEI